MEEDFFDIAIEGTTINDIHAVEENSRKIVFDGEDNYGSTYTSLKKLAKSQYIKDLTIIKSTDDHVTVEALPFLLRSTHSAVKGYSKKPFGGHIEYVDISNVIFMDQAGKVVRLPTCKSDIVRMECISNTTRYYLHESIKSGNMCIFKEYLANNCDKEDIFYKAFIKYGLFSEKCFPAFGEPPFVYPVYGSSELSENMSLTNSLKGYSYLLNGAINISKGGSNGYKYRLVCEYGVVYFNQLLKQNLKRKTCNVRMVQIGASLHGGNFLAYFELSEIIQVIGLDERTKTCPKDMQTLYFLKMNGPVTQEEVHRFIGTDMAVHIDLSYQTVFDPSQFEDYCVNH